MKKSRINIDNLEAVCPTDDFLKRSYDTLKDLNRTVGWMVYAFDFNPISFYTDIKQVEKLVEATETEIYKAFIEGELINEYFYCIAYTEKEIFNQSFYLEEQFNDAIREAK